MGWGGGGYSTYVGPGDIWAETINDVKESSKRRSRIKEQQIQKPWDENKFGQCS